MRLLVSFQVSLPLMRNRNRDNDLDKVWFCRSFIGVSYIFISITKPFLMVFLLLYRQVLLNLRAIDNRY